MDFGMSLDSSSVGQRHCFEDSDDEEENASSELSIIRESFTLFPENIEKGQSTTVLFITIGDAASIFAKSYFSLKSIPSSKILANSVTVFKNKFFPGNKISPTHTVSEFLNIEPKDEGSNLTLCDHPEMLNSQYCNVWCAELMRLFQPKVVLILTSRKSYEYSSPHPQGSDHDPAHFLKGLQSDSWTLPHFATDLEAPNTIIGEPAAVLTHCQLHSVPAALVICYSQPTQTTAESVSAFLPILKHPLLSDNIVIEPSQRASQTVKKLIPSPRKDLNHLYT